MELLKLIKQSIYSPAFYRELLNKPFSFSFKYFYSLGLVIALVFTLFASLAFVPVAHSFLKSLGGKVLSYYPEGLEIRIKNHVASTNEKEPYFLPFPEELRSDRETRSDPPENLLVIDTQKSFNLEEFQAHKTALLLNRESVAFEDGEGVVRIEPLVRFPDVTITKPIIESYVRKLTPFLKALPALLVFMLFFFSLLLFSMYLFYFLLGGIIVWGIGKIKKLDIPYKKAYQIAMHAATLGIVLSFGGFLLLPDAKIPFLFTVLLAVMAWVNLKPSEQTLPL